MKKIAFVAIRLYQIVFRTLFKTQNVCRFIPTCSDYAYEAIDKYGVIEGSIMGIRRIARCHPLAKGGFDPVK